MNNRQSSLRPTIVVTGLVLHQNGAREPAKKRQWRAVVWRRPPRVDNFT